MTEAAHEVVPGEDEGKITEKMKERARQKLKKVSSSVMVT